jgi:arylsulfatase A-like enzyme
MIRACFGYTTLIDDQIGRILKVIKELGLYEDTAIFFTSDHGGMVGGHRLCDKGPFLYDELLRIPFVARIPGLAEGGTRNGNWIYNFDLMPTFIDIAGGRTDNQVDASSIVPVLKGVETRESVMYAEFYGHQVPTSQRVIRTERFKYIFNGSHSDELYDLERDPWEMMNLLDDPEYKVVLQELREQLLQYVRENGDLIERYYIRTRLRRKWISEF